jgi:hypothetical protein
MKKKLPRSKGYSSPKKNIDSEVLGEIQRKILASSALNGGFDKLLYKIDKIEQSQDELVTKVDKIHDAIYDPSEGIFSKLGDYKLENSSKVSEIEQSISEIHVWKEIKDKDEAREDQVVNSARKKIDDLEKSVDSLIRSKNDVWSVAKWFLVAIGGGIVTLIIKWIETKFR